MNKKFILLTGGTGGHVIPAITFANFLIENGYECHLILDQRGKKFNNKFNGTEHKIYASHFSGNFFYKFKSLIKLIIGFFQSLILIAKIQPKYCISFGSYATFAPLLAILFYRIFFNINIFIHEQNSILGKVNLYFLPYINKLFTNFPSLKNLKEKYNFKKMHVGLPSKKICNIKNINFKSTPKIKNIFIYGGSQGSFKLINNTLLMLNSIFIKNSMDINFIIQSPKNIIKDVSNTMDKLKLKYEIKEFFNNIDEILSKTDIAITRAGAGTINDLIKYAIPSIIFPLPNSIYNHQLYNAKYLSDKNAAILLDENNFNIEINSIILENLINNYQKRDDIKNILKSIKLTDANQIMLSHIIK